MNLKSTIVKMMALRLPKAGLIGAMCFICISCATQYKFEKVSVGDKASNQTYIDRNLSCFLLTPKVNYESIIDEKKLDYGQSEIELEKYLESQALQAFKDKGFKLKDTKQVLEKAESFNKELLEISKNSDLIFRGYLEDEIKRKIVDFGNKYDIPALLVIDCNVKVGTGGTWDSYSGAITSKNDRTLLKATIIRTSDCSKLWFANVQLRELPKIGDTNLNKAINSIFTNLTPKGD
jgi:hypothetical protein